MTQKRRGRRSRLSRTVEGQVHIDWPHFYVYRGADREPTQFMELTLAEFTFGYLAMIDNPRSSSFTCTIMLEILKDMMLDSTLYGWYQMN